MGLQLPLLSMLSPCSAEEEDRNEDSVDRAIAKGSPACAKAYFHSRQLHNGPDQDTNKILPLCSAEDLS